MTLVWNKLFDERDIEVYSTKTSGHDNLAVTFDFSSVPGRPPHVPASNFFEKIRFDQIHVVTKKDIWYQTQELTAVAQIVMQRRKNYKRLITYGNSMGAYGALLISGMVDATDIIAFAPQYTVDTGSMPEETRWIDATSKITFLYNDLKNYVASEARKFIIFDPLCKEDLRHIKLLRRNLDVHEVKIPFAGHFPSSYLHELGCLIEAMECMLFGPDPIRSVASTRRSKRIYSSRYFTNMSLSLMSRGSSSAALSVASRAYGMDPDKPETIEALLSIASRIPEIHAFSHIAIRLLQKINMNFCQYDGMRQELLSLIRSRHRLLEDHFDMKAK